MMLSAALTDKAMALYDPKLCFLLDGFLVVYGLVITGMFIKEKVSDDLKGSDGGGGYQPLVRDAERGRVSRPNFINTPTPDKHSSGLSSATRDTYDSLQMQPLPAR
uniref:T-cell surface glycoprotein CD3 zeta chain n=1 Tax=Scophthalmus maximus TaxID=52904 RepID=A0A8D2ZCK6_SCOMX